MTGYSKSLAALLPKMLDEISKTQEMRPDLILAAWPEIVGPKLAPMTQAVGFESGMLQVKVNNATLHSLLAGYEKYRLLKKLQDKFPKIEIRNIIFRLG